MLEHFLYGLHAVRKVETLAREPVDVASKELVFYLVLTSAAHSHLRQIEDQAEVTAEYSLWWRVVMGVVWLRVVSESVTYC